MNHVATRYTDGRMPLAEQESRCVELACRHLAEANGGTWVISDDLDEQNPSEPSPEVRVTNGITTAAIEVKRIIGDEAYLTYRESFYSLVRYLTPSCGGNYILNPALDFRLPMEPGFRKHVRREIERVAPTIAHEETGAIQIPRQAFISHLTETGPGHISCYHNSTGHFIQEVSPRLKEKFQLVDGALWEHSFVTDEAKQEFQDAVFAACERRSDGDPGPFSWTEEWELIRGAKDAEDGVWLIVSTGARDVYGTLLEAVSITLEKARTKFEDRRWADIHMVVFDRASVLITVAGVAGIAAEFDPEDLGAIDVILVADGNEISQVWPPG